MKLLKVGDQVYHRMLSGDYKGVVTVDRIERLGREDRKYGTEVDEVFWTESFVVDLSNGHWAYNNQIKPID